MRDKENIGVLIYRGKAKAERRGETKGRRRGSLISSLTKQSCMGKQGRRPGKRLKDFMCSVL